MSAPRLEANAVASSPSTSSYQATSGSEPLRQYDKSIQARATTHLTLQQDLALAIERDQLVGCWPAEELLAEQRVPGTFAHHPQLDLVLGIGAQQPIDDEQVTTLEVVAHLIEEYLKQGADFEKAVRETVLRLTGIFALSIISADYPNTIISARQGPRGERAFLFL